MKYLKKDIKTTFKMTLLTGALAVLLLTIPSWTIDLRLTGSWTLMVDLSDMQGPAGSELAPEYESTQDESKIKVNKAKNKYWAVDIRKEDINWHTDLRFYVRRTSDGRGKGWVAGGLIYIESTGTDSQLITGFHDMDLIYLQFKLTGVSTNLSSDTYSANIIYTLTETQ